MICLMAVYHILHILDLIEVPMAARESHARATARCICRVRYEKRVFESMSRHESRGACRRAC